MNDTVICSGCGRAHPKSETELGFHWPDAVHGLTDDEKRQRCRQSSDACVLDERHFFVRGCLPFVVSGRTLAYNIGVWAEVPKAVFGRIYDLWSDPAQVSEPRFLGTLANELPLQPNTLGLALEIQLTGPTTRPEFILVATTHPLCEEQAHGITAHRAAEYSDAARKSSAA